MKADDVKKYLKYLLLGLIVLIVFNQYAVFIILTILFTAMGVTTNKASRIVPHISIESISASATLIGYVWGWKVGLAFGFIIGMFAWIQVGLVKHTTITAAVFMGFSGVLGALFQPIMSTFFGAYFLAFIVKMPINWIVMGAITSDPFENFMHSFGDGFFSLFVYGQLMNIIYIIIRPLVG